MSPKQPTEEEYFVRGFHGIPDDSKLESMSFSELASELAGAEAGSPKFMVIEREMKKHLAKDQARANRNNIILGASIGLIGVILGAFIRSSIPSHDIASTNSTKQQSAIEQPVIVAPPEQNKETDTNAKNDQ